MAKSNGSSRTSQRSQSDNSAQPQALNETMAALTRQQMVQSEDWLAQFFRMNESLQRAQQQFSERAVLLHSQAAENLRRATNAAELGYIQSNLIVSWMQEAVRLCVDMTTATAKIGNEALQRTAATTEEENSAEQATSAASAAMNAAVPPMMQAWQSFFTAPLGGDNYTRH